MNVNIGWLKNFTKSETCKTFSIVMTSKADLGTIAVLFLAYFFSHFILKSKKSPPQGLKFIIF